jgi:hypothetical protein
LQRLQGGRVIVNVAMRGEVIETGVAAQMKAQRVNFSSLKYPSGEI